LSLSTYNKYAKIVTHVLSQGGPEELATQGMNLLCKLETSEASPPTTSSAYNGGCDWMMMMMGESSGPDHAHHEYPSCCRPLKTLDLFPTKSTGLKDECSTSKSSSCSTSTN